MVRHVLDLFDCDRLTETTLSVKGETIDAWYSGKHRDFGANIQAIMCPDGLPLWTSAALPGHLHDTSCTRELGVTAALNWSAAELHLSALADFGYESAGHGIKTPVKQPTDGSRLALDNRAYNRLLRGLRWQGERGFAILIGRWKTLRHNTVSPRRTGDIVTAALHLTHSSTNTYRKVVGISSVIAARHSGRAVRSPGQRLLPSCLFLPLLVAGGDLKHDFAEGLP